MSSFSAISISLFDLMLEFHLSFQILSKVFVVVWYKDFLFGLQLKSKEDCPQFKGLVGEVFSRLKVINVWSDVGIDERLDGLAKRAAGSMLQFLIECLVSIGHIMWSIMLLPCFVIQVGVGFVLVDGEIIDSMFS